MRADPEVLRCERSLLLMKEQTQRAEIQVAQAQARLAEKKADLLQAMRIRSEHGLPPDPTDNVAPAPPMPPPQFGPAQDEVNRWMVRYYREARGREPPKRDDDSFPACRAAIGATHRQMVVAMREVPAKFKRKRGQRSEKPNRANRALKRPLPDKENADRRA
jgi:hypothetical protein